MNNNGAFVKTTTSLPLSAWTLVTATYSIFEVGNAGSLVIYFGSTLAGIDKMTVSSTAGLTFLASDIFTIGGPNSFLGKMVNFRIYSPGSQLIIQRKARNFQPNLLIFLATCSSAAYSSCSLSFGWIDLSLKDCLVCPSGSKFYNSECIVCPANQYASGYECFSKFFSLLPPENI